MVKQLIVSTDLAAHNFVHFLLQTGATPCTFTSEEKKQQPEVWISMYDRTCIWSVYNNTSQHGNHWNAAGEYRNEYIAYLRLYTNHDPSSHLLNILLT